MSFSETLNAIKHFLWPARCVACDVLLEHPKHSLCEECGSSIRLCHDITPPPSIEIAMAFFMYEGAVQDLMSRWKFHSDFAAQNALLELCERYAEDILPSDTPNSPVIVPVPPHPERLRDRGYDPVWTFAKHLTKIWEPIAKRSIPTKTDLLIRLKHTPRQATLSKQERQENLKGAFKVKGRINQPVILVDDVITTGSTAQACAEVLVEAGATHILLIGLAHSHNMDA